MKNKKLIEGDLCKEIMFGKDYYVFKKNFTKHFTVHAHVFMTSYITNNKKMIISIREKGTNRISTKCEKRFRGWSTFIVEEEPDKDELSNEEIISHLYFNYFRYKNCICVNKFFRKSDMYTKLYRDINYYLNTRLKDNLYRQRDKCLIDIAFEGAYDYKYPGRNGINYHLDKLDDINKMINSRRFIINHHKYFLEK